MSVNSISNDSSPQQSQGALEQQGQCVHELVQAHALATPDAVALASGDHRVSYRDLNARAEVLARRLRALGVKTNVAVGLCMTRSADLAIAALGILKAGGAYVPLDPGYPAQRLEMLLQDANCPVLVTNSESAEKVPAGKWRIVLLDEIEAAIEREKAKPASAEDLGMDRLAYIIFTSGSTGRPKGVKISHANLTNLVQWHRRAFGVTPADRATMQSSPGFDAAVWELWPYLASGASLHIIDDTVRATPEALRDWIVRCGITISFLPTVIAESMIALPWSEECAFRTLLTGADTLRRRPVKNLPFTLINNYGPTECTVVATSGVVKADTEAAAIVEPGSNGGRELPSIGVPIDNVSVYVVDEQLKQVAPGESGELLIGGRGVGQGYLNVAERTAESFIPDRFGGTSGGRLYRTGDLVRRSADGELHFLGRLDDQIKILGYRIEPNEIAAVLNSHPKVETSHVSAFTDSAENRRLVAYVIARGGEQLRADELQEFLNAHLPQHMVPSAFVRIDRLPLSANGKIDRRALPQPSSENLLRADAADENQSEEISPIEEHLSALLTRLLAIESVGRDDNFFTLGGHSLMGAQLIAKIRESFGVELTLRNLFEEPTVRGMSHEIERLIHVRMAAMSDDEAQRLLASSEGL